VAQRRFETTLFDLVSMISEATQDDARTVRFVAELIRQGRAFDAWGVAVQLSMERDPRTVRPPLSASHTAGANMSR